MSRAALERRVSPQLAPEFRSNPQSYGFGLGPHPEYSCLRDRVAMSFFSHEKHSNCKDRFAARCDYFHCTALWRSGNGDRGGLDLVQVILSGRLGAFLSRCDPALVGGSMGRPAFIGRWLRGLEISHGSFLLETHVLEV